MRQQAFNCTLDVTVSKSCGSLSGMALGSMPFAADMS